MKALCPAGKPNGDIATRNTTHWFVASPKAPTTLPSRLETKLKQTTEPSQLYLRLGSQTNNLVGGKIPISSLRPLQCELIGSLSHFLPKDRTNISGIYDSYPILYVTTCPHFGTYGCNKRRKHICGMNLCPML